MFKAVRCLECGYQLTSSPIAFDLTDEPPATSPTWTKWPLLDRWVGAISPFVLSLLWLGFIQLTPTEELPKLSMLAAPILRIFFPLMAYKLLAERYPWLSAGFRNALWASVAFAVALGLLFLIALPFWLTLSVSDAISSGLNGYARQFDTGVRLTPALLATTLMAQALLAIFLPPAVSITPQGIRFSKRTLSIEALLGALLVLCLAARWVLPADWRTGQTLAAIVIGGLLIVLGCIRAARSEHLNTSQRIIAFALVVMLGGLTCWAVQ